MWNLEESKFDYKNNHLWRKKFSEILRSEVHTKWESSRITRRRIRWKKIERKSWHDSKTHFTDTRIARESEFLERFWWISISRIKFLWKNSHFPSQLAVIPGPRSMLSCDTRLTGSLENVFGNPRSMIESSQTPYQGILRSTTSSTAGAISVHVCSRTRVARGKERIGSTTTMSMSDRRPSTMIFSVDIPQDSMVGQQRRQETSELQLHKFPTHATLSCWKIRFKNQVTGILTTCFVRSFARFQHKRTIGNSQVCLNCVSGVSERVGRTEERAGCNAARKRSRAREACRRWQAQLEWRSSWSAWAARSCPCWKPVDTKWSFESRKWSSARRRETSRRWCASLTNAMRRCGSTAAWRCCWSTARQHVMSARWCGLAAWVRRTVWIRSKQVQRVKPAIRRSFPRISRSMSLSSRWQKRQPIPRIRRTVWSLWRHRRP